MRLINPAKFAAKIGQTPPPEYARRKEEIEAETRLLAFRCSLENSREPTDQEVSRIVSMKLDMDRILGDWIDPVSS